MHDPTTFAQPGGQSFLQFKLRREQLLAGNAGGLDAVGDDERDWDHLPSLGQGGGYGKFTPILASCSNCHNAPVVRSIFSFGRSSLVTSLADEEGRIGAWKREQNSWKLLEEIRKSAPTK